jgi:hypothetical protein
MFATFVEKSALIRQKTSHFSSTAFSSKADGSHISSPIISLSFLHGTETAVRGITLRGRQFFGLLHVGAVFRDAQRLTGASGTTLPLSSWTGAAHSMSARM